MNKEITKLEIDASNGNKEAQRQIAREYFNIDDEFLNKKGFFWCEHLANRNDVPSLLLLSDYYKRGIGCKKSFFKAEEVLIAAKNLGSKEAETFLAEMRLNNQIEKTGGYITVLVTAIILFFLGGGLISIIMLIFNKRERLFMAEYNSFRGKVYGEGFLNIKKRKLQALPFEGYSFVGWYDNNELLTKNEILEMKIKKNITVQCVFIKKESEDNHENM